jgi:23S rRNA (uracil1939-C5)-methyltransferase
MLEISPKRIVYVSCNPATQARDIAILSEKYEVTSMIPVDMFPQTAHVESIGTLELKAQ